MSEVFIPITYDEDGNWHVRQPHTTEAGAAARAEEALRDEPEAVWYEIHMFSVITD